MVIAFAPSHRFHFPPGLPVFKRPISRRFLLVAALGLIAGSLPTRADPKNDKGIGGTGAGDETPQTKQTTAKKPRRHRRRFSRYRKRTTQSRLQPKSFGRNHAAGAGGQSTSAIRVAGAASG
jgi:hypothetical protein